MFGVGEIRDISQLENGVAIRIPLHEAEFIPLLDDRGRGSRLNIDKDAEDRRQCKIPGHFDGAVETSSHAAYSPLYTLATSYLRDFWSVIEALQR